MQRARCEFAARPENHILHETGTGGDLIVEHDEVQLVAALGGQQHAAGLLPHHLARRQVRHGDERLAEQQITCRLTDAAKQHIVDEAYDPEFGARPLRRYVQHTVETMLSRKILEGRITTGSTVTVDCRDGELVLA